MKLAGIALLASSLLVAPAAFSQTHNNTVNHKERTRPTAEQTINRRVDRLAVVFNLTPEQKNEAASYFKTAYDSNHDVIVHLRQDRKTLRSDVNNEADQAKLTADATVIGQDQAKIVANNANAQEQFLSILTPQEQAKYDKLEGTMRFGWAGGMAPGALYR